MSQSVAVRWIVALVIAVIIACAVLLFPPRASAAPFGGAIGQIIFCYNDAIWETVGPPRGGTFIWTPSTKTYEFGPPAHSGQWLLGLSGAPYFCVVQIDPVVVYPGISITMMGSSQ